MRGIFIAVTAGLASLFAAQEIAAEEQAVIVHFYNYGSMDDLSRLFDLQHRLEAAIEKANAGFWMGTKSRSVEVMDTTSCTVPMRTHSLMPCCRY